MPGLPFGPVPASPWLPLAEANAMSRAKLKSDVFLTARWRHLAMLSYPVDPAVLEPFLPPQLEIIACAKVAVLPLPRL